MRSTVRGSNAVRGKCGFSVIENAQTGSVACLASYSIRTGAVKRHGSEADHSVPSSAEVKNGWSFTPLPLYAFMACAGAAVYFNPNFLNCDLTVLFGYVTKIVGFVVDSGRRDPSNPHPPNS